MAKVGRKSGTPKTGGRKKGTPNKFTGELKDMVLQALTNAGGVRYLRDQAKESPAAFLGLVGRLLPKDVNLNGSLTWEEIVEASRK